MIPKEIKHKDVVKAIKHVISEGYPKARKSKHWDLMFEGEPFPPKYIISKASEFSTYGKFLYHHKFGAIEAINFFKKNQFQIVPKNQYGSVEVIDDLLSENEAKTKESLKKAVERLKEFPPERIEKIMDVTNRKDTSLIQILKTMYNNKCQMPECNSVIKKKNGENYCEVAHIIPFSEVKSSALDNLIVLCPNHHKEFDLGDKQILHKSKNIVKGILNGRVFEFTLKNI